ncbi:putative membrane protein YphA (DoxX/SURF4 family) [Kitasatospora sp. MAA4]|uniref:DoxX family membrane protein n=1 Tax=Kitasatospora sp. MAA4 TaxID=3035093 RepID=UPI0024749FE1|nr:DoxX family membrane protein [Kitasatospora sp. MAA4]MDH6135356.1 putative membrane protein YphA (DoxX/SURF4 family) [Kitasatospora sp. MAA4]
MPSDPARLSSTQVSFRVRMPVPATPMIQAPPLSTAPYADAFGRPYAPLAYAGRPGLVRVGAADTAAGAVAGSAVLSGGGLAGGAPRRKARVTAVTWSGQTAPGDLAATQLLDAVRLNTVPSPAGASLGGGGLAEPGSTQLLEPVPGWDSGPGNGYGRGSVPRQPNAASGSSGSSGTLSGAGRKPARPEPVGWRPGGDQPQAAAPAPAAESSRHARYPGRRVDLGLVLLPLRLLLGSLTVYEGFAKLCDPVYFDGGQRGSMMRWLASLHPWKVAQPLLDFAMAHPVGAGLGVAFTEIVVGVLSLLGLWQRLAAAAAMLLSAALLFTVSWRAVPVYDTPDLIFLAAWSPLLIAGAPFASLDGRLALEAWRRYGTDAPKAVRRRVLRRGTVVAAVVIGLTMLLGSMLGAAVRTGGRPQPLPAKPPTDFGTPLWPATGAPHASGSAAPSAAPSSSAPASPSPSASASPSSHKSAKPHTSAGTSGAGGADATGNSASQGGGSSSGTAPGSSGSSGSAGTSPGSGSGNRAPKPSPSGGGGLIGGVLGSGPPAVQLPTLGLQATPAAARPVV